jgi:hypothetical protein
MAWFREHFDAGKGFPFKAFLSKKGFMVHLCMTYKFLTPFMKGFHLLTDSWRQNRAKDGWKVQSREWESYLQGAMEREEITEAEYEEMVARDGNEEAPEVLFSDERFSDNLIALESFFEIKPLVLDRVSWLALVVYAFTDASGLGFGDTFLFDDDIEYTIMLQKDPLNGMVTGDQKFKQKLRGLWKEESFLEGSSLLRKFCQQCWGLESISPSMVSKLLHLR